MISSACVMDFRFLGLQRAESFCQWLSLSDSATISTGSPQGCVLSPLLFILYIDKCRSRQKHSYLIKFSDDTALLSLLDGSESNHESALTDFISCCDFDHS